LAICVASSFVATFLFARWFRRQNAEPPQIAVRVDLDEELDDLDPAELQRVLRFTRELKRHRVDSTRSPARAQRAES
jgi:hypothetical protein